MSYEDKEKFLHAVQQSGPMSPEHKKELRHLIKNPVIMRALCEILAEADAQAVVLLGIDFEDPVSRGQAARVQGKAYGLTRAVEFIIDSAFDEEDINAK